MTDPMSEKRIQWRRREARQAEYVGISPMNSASLLRDIMPRLDKAVEGLASERYAAIGRIDPFGIATELKDLLVRGADAEIAHAKKAMDGIAPEMLASEPYNEYPDIIEHENAIKAELDGSPDAVMLEAIEAIESERWSRLNIVVDLYGAEHMKLMIRNAVVEAIKAGWPYT